MSYAAMDGMPFVLRTADGAFIPADPANIDWERLCRNLKSGGWIMLGHSETIADMALPLRQVGHTAFQKV